MIKQWYQWYRTPLPYIGTELKTVSYTVGKNILKRITMVKICRFTCALNLGAVANESFLFNYSIPGWFPRPYKFSFPKSH
ncbi:hypothetical protein T11_15813 [Trichinella zimbabwensis]|uniref:Uncharacterized protein n=1 Tax=Trichinella zimbabwensis TaxID=268475 RepID=A0A0V1GSC6_9BILA|nr:hypothetical protein T11_445 [Trichinella zimbabwensis]KRZ04573.1 hypothetical protein T11_15813 [Trichinella zimbabwensis]